MKKVIKITAIALLSLILIGFCSCNKEEEDLMIVDQQRSSFTVEDVEMDSAYIYFELHGQTDLEYDSIKYYAVHAVEHGSFAFWHVYGDSTIKEFPIDTTGSKDVVYLDKSIYLNGVMINTTDLNVGYVVSGGESIVVTVDSVYTGLGIRP